MTTRLRKAVASRLEGPHRDEEKGFTLIELLVVVIIIGILAAIAIPVYIGVQNNAKDSAVQSDLTNIKTAIVAYVTDRQTTTLPTLDSTLSGYGYTKSGQYFPGKDPKFSTSPASSTALFCVGATSSTSSSKSFWVSSNNGVQTGNCPASSTNW